MNKFKTEARRCGALASRLALVVTLGSTSASSIQAAGAPTAPAVRQREGSTVLAFNTERAFEAFVSERGTVRDRRFVSRRQALAVRAGESRLLTKNLENPVSDDFPLLPYLSTDGLIEIGARTFKIDFDREIVGVLERARPGDLARLKAGDLGHGRIQWFRFTDDVFDLLESGSTGTVRSEADTLVSAPAPPFAPASSAVSASAVNPSDCTGPYYYGSFSDWDKAAVNEIFKYHAYDSETSSSCRAWVADTKHVYQRTGVYYSLQSKIKYARTQNNCMDDGGVPWTLVNQYTDMGLDVSWDYCRKVRFHSCRRSTGSESHRGIGEHEMSYRSYEGSRSLEWFALDTTFVYKRADPCAELLADKNRTIVMPRISKDY